jgi:hypothetical protein
MRLRSAEADDRGFLVEMARLASALQGRPLPAADDALVRGLLPVSLDAAIIATDEVGARHRRGRSAARGRLVAHP